MVVLGSALAAVACGDFDREGADPRHLELDIEQTESGLPKGGGGVNGQLDYCTGGLTCDAGEGDCDTDLECEGVLVCGYDNGPNFGFPTGWDSCVMAHCRNGVTDGDETGLNCGPASECGPCVACPANGLINTCESATCPCAAGWGDCDNNNQCQAGLVCGGAGGVANGVYFGMNSAYQVCVAAHCANGTQDGDEAGLDCGGADCGDCGFGAGVATSCAVAVNNCGATGTENCCSSPEVPATGYTRNYDGVTLLDATNRVASLSAVNIDKFEVTVSRFRKFVNAFSAWRAAGNPAVGAGANPVVAGSGWQAAWDAQLPTTGANLQVAIIGCGSLRTWLGNPGTTAQESKPMNCVNWYEAFAFCAWDGGYLPTEAEWNSAAAGGSQQRVYPWSSPATDQTLDFFHAVYQCLDPTAPYTCHSGSIPTPAGSRASDSSRWGHRDLAGGLWEWTRDFWDNTLPFPCTNCANLGVAMNIASSRVLKGGSWRTFTLTNLAGGFRSRLDPSSHQDHVGIRCARP